MVAGGEGQAKWVQMLKRYNVLVIKEVNREAVPCSTVTTAGDAAPCT